MTKKSRRKGWGSEAVGILYFALAAYFALSLLSFHPVDPTWFGGGDAAVRNLGGRVGANLADGGLQILGLAIPLVPLLLFLSGWKRFRTDPPAPGYSRGIGYSILLVSSCGVLQILFRQVRLEGEPMAAGGMVGILLERSLLPALSRGGIFLLSTTGIAVGLLVATRLSFRDVLLAIRRKASRWSQLLRLRMARYWEARRRQRLRTAVIRKHREIAAARTGKSRAAEKPRSRAPTKIFRKDTNPVTPPPVQKPLPFKPPKQDPYIPPPIQLLEEPSSEVAIEDKQLVETARQITARFREFGVEGTVLQIHPGPVVTTYEFRPEAGIKYNRITGLSEELCLAVQVESIRIDRISGKSTVGIQVPNPTREMISLRDLLTSPPYLNSPYRLPLTLGKRIHGEPYVVDLCSMPHLLIAGSTGTGKSVALNCMITSILYKAHPDQVKFLMIDTKRLELGFYVDIPHLLTPVVTEAKKAAVALRWATQQMEQRYRQLADSGARTLEQYNQALREENLRRPVRTDPGDPEKLSPIPYMVIVIDELADLMIVSGKEVEESITRLAQMARAVGIHLILSTQRPSVDVITGVIKANFPCRIALRVSTKVDYRTILDSNGAEQLLGKGDMLFLPPGSARLVRLHGPMLTEVELTRVIRHLCRQGKPTYDDSVTKERVEDRREGPGNTVEDSMYPEAVRMVVQSGQASISHLQRRMRLGYARAARLVDRMEAEGIVGPPDGSRAREVLFGGAEFEVWERGRMEGE